MRNDKGSVVAETALVLPSLLLLVTTLMMGLSAIDTKFKCEQLASSVARAIERQEPHWRAMAREALPDAGVEVRTDDEWITVVVTKKVVLGFEVSGRSIAPQHQQ